jgi:hypothetical protein
MTKIKMGSGQIEKRDGREYMNDLRKEGDRETIQRQTDGQMKDRNIDGRNRCISEGQTEGLKVKKERADWSRF